MLDAMRFAVCNSNHLNMSGPAGSDPAGPLDFADAIFLATRGPLRWPHWKRWVAFGGAYVKKWRFVFLNKCLNKLEKS